MPIAYRVTLEPISTDDEEVYVLLKGDAASWGIPEVNDYDAHDMILCDYEGYMVVAVDPVSVDEALSSDRTCYEFG